MPPDLPPGHFEGPDFQASVELHVGDMAVWDMTTGYYTEAIARKPREAGAPLPGTPYWLAQAGGATLQLQPGVQRLFVLYTIDENDIATLLIVVPVGHAG